MRKNPYSKNIQELLPLFMQGPNTTTALIANEGQKSVVKKGMDLPPVQKYNVGSVSFTMVKAPFLSLVGSINPKTVLNIEMGQTEVTQEFFKAVTGKPNPSKFVRNPKRPVEYITWFDCLNFCNKLSTLLNFEPCYTLNNIAKSGSSIDKAEITWNEKANGFRLPTSEEWVLFKKAGTQNAWAGCNDKADVQRYAWVKDNSAKETHPVGEKLPNEWGLYDMSGNVAEWCWDEKEEDPRQRVVRGLFYSHEVEDPNNGDGDPMMRTPANTRDNRVGFRIARTIR